MASPTSSSDSDSDAPEAIPLTQSKKLVQKHNAHIQKAGAMARERAKSGNREKDRKLKERAAENKEYAKREERKGEEEAGEAEEDVAEEDQGGGEEVDDARTTEDEGEDRNESEGAIEGSSDSEVEGMDEDGSDAEDFGMEELGEDREIDSDSSDEDESMDSEVDSDPEPEPSPTKPSKLDPVKKSANYLPDELFKAAFSQKKTAPQASNSQKADLTKKRNRKPKHALSTPKDIIVGSRAIRTLASTKRPVHPSATVPSSKINKFLNRTLALKGRQRVPGKGWERKPANIGVLRRNGPAAHFVRNR